MGEEWDRQLVPQLFQSMLTLSMGAAFKGFEALKSPQDSARTTWDEMKALFSIPDDAGEGLEEKAKAVAAVWMEKGATWMENFREAGNQFTHDEEDSA